eukprot:461823_1
MAVTGSTPDWKDCQILVSRLGPSRSSNPNASDVYSRLSKNISSFTVIELRSIIRYFQEKFARVHLYPSCVAQTAGVRKPLLVAYVNSILVFNNTEYQARVGNSQQKYQAAVPQRAIPVVRSNIRNARPLTDSEVQELCNSKEFLQNRSPFHVLHSTLGAVRIQSGGVTRLDCVLTKEILQPLHTHMECFQLSLQLRLFCADKKKHTEWNSLQIAVEISGNQVVIDTRAHSQGVKKKGARVVPPLDITRYVTMGGRRDMAAMQMSVSVFCRTPFRGIVVAEVVRKRSTQEVVSSLTLSRDDIKPKVCEYCGKTTDLMRCSRCKHAWYCGGGHQSEHWKSHSLFCEPPGGDNAHSSSSHVQSDHKDDDVAVVDTRVGLRCPLSIARIKVAAKGADCLHPACFNLATFLGFCQQTGVWQCPICLKGLPFSKLVIDSVMNKILKETGKEIYQVRLMPDGKYVEVSLEEERAQDDETQQRPSKRRRKHKPHKEHIELDSDSEIHNGPSGPMQNSVVTNGVNGVSHGASISSAIVLD